MESRRRGKRKSPCQAIIFEVSDDDVSSEQSDCNEPEAKILKTEDNTFQLKLSENSNLESDSKVLSPKVSVSQDNSVEIEECISSSNTSFVENSSSPNDIIIITEDNTEDASNENEVHAKSNENSLNSVIDITEENINPVKEDDTLKDDEVHPKPNENSSDSVIDITEENLNLLKNEDFNLEEGELADIQSTPRDQVDTPKSPPCICITFSDEKIAEVYRLKFLKFLQSFVELEVDEEDYTSLTINIQRDSDLPTDWVVLDETVCAGEIKEIAEEKLASPLPPTPIVTPSKKKKRKRFKKERDLFVVDTTPQNDGVGHHTKYSTNFQIDMEQATTEEETVKMSSGQTCFNCDGNHAIKDCPLPKDFAKINAARQKFKAQKQTSRYHLEEDQKYGHLVPGKISDQLRQAMDLRKNQLPHYIYHMRRLGYPPGWLEEAKLVHSNLKVFNWDSINDRGGTKKQQGLDPAKIVDYPGFNVPLEKDAKDEYRQYQVPPFSENFSKKAMIEFFERQFGEQQDDLEACNSNLDNTVEETKEKTIVMVEMTKETIVRNPLIKELKDVEPDLPSPSLTDLEKQKENLLAALDDGSNPKSSDTPCEGPQKIVDPEVSSDLEKPHSSRSQEVPLGKPLEIDVESAQDSSMPYLSPPLNSSISSVKNSSFGTPLLKSNSPYSQLPKLDNFMKDVSPVINFENLPNSTGTYDKMTGVLQKVRSTLKNLPNC